MKTINAAVDLWRNPATPEERLKHIERAGRVCYKSEDRIADGSAEKLIRAIINRGHTSVLEHGNIILQPMTTTFIWIKTALIRALAEGRHYYLRLSQQGLLVSGNVRAWRDFLKDHLDSGLPKEIVHFMLDNPVLFEDLRVVEHTDKSFIWDWDITGSVAMPERVNLADFPAEVRAIHQTHTIHFTVDRGVSHEIVRHRTLSFSQESTRYCNYAKDQFGREITVIQPPCAGFGSALGPSWLVGCMAAENAYFSMLDAGAVAQEARAVLPNSLKTEIVVTGHDNDWLKFLHLRTAKDAHPDIRNVACVAAWKLFNEDPEVFAGCDNFVGG